MKQVLNRRGTIVVEEVPEPQCGRGQVKIALTHSLISAGTELRSLELQGQGLATRARNRPDLVKKILERARSQGVQAAYRAVREKLDEPKALGYSATGIVREVGFDVTGFGPGDRVSCGGAGAAHAEIVCVPENLVVHVPENVVPEHAAFATVGSIAMQGVRRANPQLGETFVVIGLGLVGQLVVQLCKAAGLHVLATDLAADRVALAKQLGADDAWTPNEADAVGRVMTHTEGLGADGVIIAAGSQSSEPVRLAMDVLRERGRLSIVGVVGLDLPWDPFYVKELDVFMSRSYGPGRYDADYEERGMKYPLSHVRWTETENMAEVLRLIADGRLNVAPLVSEVHPVGDAARAYERLESAEPKPIGVLLSHNGRLREPVVVTNRPASRQPRRPAGVAVIGCGGFAKQERLPFLKTDAAFRIEML
ncbi:MAG: zinc-binding alcohol dehydrogenase, partial [Candidatus Hydrogenedentota bacterium]